MVRSTFNIVIVFAFSRLHSPVCHGCRCSCWLPFFLFICVCVGSLVWLFTCALTPKSQWDQLVWHCLKLHLQNWFINGALFSCYHDNRLFIAFFGIWCISSLPRVTNKRCDYAIFQWVNGMYEYGNDFGFMFAHTKRW